MTTLNSAGTMALLALSACVREPAQPAAEPQRSDARAARDVCNIVDRTTTLDVLGLPGGKLKATQVAGGSACAAFSPAGDRLVQFAVSMPIGTATPEARASRSLPNLTDALAEPVSPQVHAPRRHTVVVKNGTSTIEMPIAIAGWADGSRDGQMGTVIAGTHLHVAAIGVEEARVLAFVQREGAKLLQPE